MITSTIYRLSVQHAHPLGPWQAILGAVQSHHARWVVKVQAQKEQDDATAKNKAITAAAAIASSSSNSSNTIPLPASGSLVERVVLLPQIVVTPLFRVLDLASGPRGEPGTTIAHALPLAVVHCTDSCSQAVADIPIPCGAVAVAVAGCGNTTEDVSDIRVEAGEAAPSCDSTVVLPVLPVQEVVPVVPLLDGEEAVLSDIDCQLTLPLPLPPKNLTKSIQDLTDLSSYDSNSIDAIVCCYGYGLSSDITQALAEAHRVLVPGGILVIASWQQSAMLSIGRDVLAYVRSGGSGYNARDEDEALFLPPMISPVDKIEWSGIGELEALLLTAGFVDDQPSDQAATAVITTRGMVYPYDLGTTPEDQFNMGTILIRQELESLGALKGGVGVDAGGWNNLAEEGFWMNIRKYVDMVEGTMFLKDNVFKLTISTKSL